MTGYNGKACGRMVRGVAVPVVLAMVAAGCVTPREPAPVGVSELPLPPPVLQVSPVPPAAPAPAVPVYRPPVVMEVEARPYINAANELVMPGRRFVVMDPGGWNPAALEHPERAAIPAFAHPQRDPVRMTAPFLGANGAFGGAGGPGVAAASLVERWAGVWITGVRDPAAEAEVSARAAADPERRVPLWTDEWGWLLVPRAMLEEEPALTGEGVGDSGGW